MFKAIAKYIAPAGMPSPVLWGEKRVVRERMRDELVALWSAANTGLNGTARVEAEYLEVVAVRA